LKSVFLASFLRDIGKLPDQKLREQVARAIEAAEAAATLQDVPQFKLLVGHSGYGRIRVREWRLGVIVRGDRLHSCGAFTAAMCTATFRDTKEARRRD